MITPITRIVWKYKDLPNNKFKRENYDHPLDLEVFHVQLFRQTHIILNLFITLGWVIFFRHSIFPQPVNGHSRNLNWRHLPYVRPNFQEIYPQFIWPEIWYQKYTSILGFSEISHWWSTGKPDQFDGKKHVKNHGFPVDFPMKTNPFLQRPRSIRPGAPGAPVPEELSDAGDATNHGEIIGKQWGKTMGTPGNFRKWSTFMFFFHIELLVTLP